VLHPDVTIGYSKARMMAADGRCKRDDLRASLSSDRVGCLRIEVRLDDDDLDVVLFHCLDQFERVRGRGRNARLGLDVPHDIEAELIGKIRPRAMIGHHFESFVWCHRGLPPLLRFGETALEVRLALCVNGGVAAVEL